MLTIERPSLTSNKLVIAAIVFSVGFIGSLSALRYFQPSLGRLASGHERSTVSPASGLSDSNKTQSSSDRTGGGKQTAASTGSKSGEVTPVAPVAVDSPVSSYSGQSATTGTTQISGQVAPAGQSTSTPSVSSPTTMTQPAATVETQPQSPASSTSSLTAPVTSLAQPVTNTASNLLPSLCTCGN